MTDQLYKECPYEIDPNKWKEVKDKKSYKEYMKYVDAVYALKDEWLKKELQKIKE